jgi:hypothetical protein
MPPGKSLAQFWSRAQDAWCGFDVIIFVRLLRLWMLASIPISGLL